MSLGLLVWIASPLFLLNLCGGITKLRRGDQWRSNTCFAFGIFSVKSPLKGDLRDALYVVVEPTLRLAFSGDSCFLRLLVVYRQHPNASAVLELTCRTTVFGIEVARFFRMTPDDFIYHPKFDCMVAIRVWSSLDPEFFHDYFLGF